MCFINCSNGCTVGSKVKILAPDCPQIDKVLNWIATLVVERPVEDERRGRVAEAAELLLERPLRDGRAVLARLLGLGLPLLAQPLPPLALLADLPLLLLDDAAVEISTDR